MVPTATIAFVRGWHDADEAVTDVVARLQVENIDRCPVVDSEGTNRLVGFLSPVDFVRAQFRHTADGDDITLVG